MDWLLRCVHCSLIKYEPFTTQSGGLVLKKDMSTALDTGERNKKEMAIPGGVAELP